MGIGTILSDLTPGGVVASLGGKIIDTIAGFFPNPAKRAEAIAAFNLAQMQGKFKEDTDNLSLLIEQAKTNEIEAHSGSVFVAGWRPGIGWVCGIGFGWSVVFVPIIQTIMTASGHSIDLMGSSSISLSFITPILLGMLGLRSYEKAKGVDTKSIVSKTNTQE